MKGLPLNCIGFQWDQHNVLKNWEAHAVSPVECEEAFFNQPLVVSEDLKHSSVEQRYYALGRTDADRHLFIAFTVRGEFIRVISARDMNRKERKIYGT